jgi:hypothetical protein
MSSITSPGTEISDMAIGTGIAWNKTSFALIERAKSAA